MTPLQDLLARFRTESPTIRDQGTAFERLMLDYFQTEPQYRDLYRTVQPYTAWAAAHLDELHLGSTGDAGIDLVATTHDGEYHAIQCKNYAADHTLQKKISTASSPLPAKRISATALSLRPPTTGRKTPLTRCTASKPPSAPSP